MSKSRDLTLMRDAMCSAMKMIRISQGEDVEIAINQGGKWESATAELIKKAKPGDRYLFTKIRYRCPGAQVDQLAETLSFELK